VGRKLKGSTVNQAVCGLRHLYNGHLERGWDIWKKIKIQREEPLPHFLARPEVDLLLATFRDARFRAFFTTVYHTGMRLGEATHLKPKHINGERHTILIPKSKNKKAREVPVTPELLLRLRRFWCAHRNPDWIFPGLSRRWKSSRMSKAEALGACRKPVSNASVQAAIKVAAAECGLSRKHDQVSTHTLRHSYATHILDAGVSVRQVAAYLGHSSLKQTMVYLHLTEISEEKARAALYTLAGHKKDTR
jgi:integrase/recombinase XerD